MKSLKLITTITVLTLSLLYVAGRPSDHKNSPIDETQKVHSAQPQVTLAPATTQLPTQKIPSVAEVSQIVRDRNNEGDQHLKILEADGWESIKVDDPPDEKLMHLSLDLLGKREEELQIQIQSNSFTTDMFDRLTEIALHTSNEKTRYIALEALGRSGERSAQLHLTHAFEQIKDEETRSQIIGYLTPEKPDDEIAIFLTEQIADPNNSDTLKKQAAFPLAAASLLTTSDPAVAIEMVSMEIPDEWKDKFATIVTLLQTGGYPATTKNE